MTTKKQSMRIKTKKTTPNIHISLETTPKQDIPIVLKKSPCSNLFKCNQLNNQHHCDKFFHICSTKNCPLKNNKQHILSFKHACWNGLNCKDPTDLHDSLYQHPVSILKKKECQDGIHCNKTNDEFHKDQYFHVCKSGNLCQHLDDQIHLNRFTHPCPNKNCSETNPLHSTQFVHPKKESIDVKPLKWEFIPKTEENVKMNFKICSFNLLAQQFISPQRYKYVKENHLDWEYRKKNLLKILLSIDADVYCLQEVDSHTLELFSELKEHYHCVLSTTKTLAMLIKKECKWKCEFQFEFLYNLDSRFLYQKVKLFSGENSIFIFNTHLIGDPSKKWIQRESAKQLLEDSEKVEGASVVCGDFNATYKDEAYVIFDQKMKSSQKILFGGNEPKFTFYTDTICKTCDYIWFKNEFIGLNGGISHFYKTIQSEIPNQEHSSDHLPITASFYFKKSLKIEKSPIFSSIKQAKELISPEIIEIKTPILKEKLPGVDEKIEMLKNSLKIDDIQFEFWLDYHEGDTEKTFEEIFKLIKNNWENLKKLK
jgi:mRNA deadenylase 3'-5' endonuclease subunit Ccr4